MDTKIKELINKSNILLEILDARFPKLCRIKYIEKYIKNKNKDLILVLNKSDLVSEDFLKKVVEEFSREYITVYMSAIYRKGSRKLRETIKKVGRKYERAYIGVFGYPNTGKSSIINILVGRRSAGTSPKPGFTKHLQIIKLSRNII